MSHIGRMRFMGRKVFMSFFVLCIFFLMIRLSWKAAADRAAAKEQERQYNEKKTSKLSLPAIKVNITTCVFPRRTTWDTFYSYIMKARACKTTYSFGGQARKGRFYDGHKLVCMDEPYKPKKKHCNILSIGISRDWSFDDAMDNYGCQVYAFDPTIGLSTFNRSDNIHFFPIGISNLNYVDFKKRPTREFMTFRNILKKVNLEGQIIDYLKMDIEGFEIQTMEQIFRHDTDLLLNVKQLGMEIHPSRDPHMRDKTWRMMHMMSCLNFTVIFSEKNMLNTFKYRDRLESACYEVVWVNEHPVARQNFELQRQKNALMDNTNIEQNSKTNGITDIQKSSNALKYRKASLQNVTCEFNHEPSWDAFYAFLMKLKPCPNTYVFGGKVRTESMLDGHKMVCMEEPVKPLKNRCNVLSFGISSDWSFDDAMDNYGCQVYSFDPSMIQKRFDRSANIHFFPIGLSDRKYTDSKGLQFMNYRNILQEIELEGAVIDYVKMDIEGFELQTMEQIIKDDRDLLMNVKQLSMEIHPGNRESDRDRAWNIMHMLNCLSFRLIYQEKNQFTLFQYKNTSTYQSACYELVWINENIVK